MPFSLCHHKQNQWTVPSSMADLILIGVYIRSIFSPNHYPPRLAILCVFSSPAGFVCMFFSCFFSFHICYDDHVSLGVTEVMHADVDCADTCAKRALFVQCTNNSTYILIILVIKTPRESNYSLLALDITMPHLYAHRCVVVLSTYIKFTRTHILITPYGRKISASVT